MRVFAIASAALALGACNALLAIEDRPHKPAVTDGGASGTDGEVPSSRDGGDSIGDGGKRSPYATAVIEAKPVVYFRFNENLTTVAFDEMNPNDAGTYSSSGISYGVTGPIVGEPGDHAVKFDGDKLTRVRMPPGVDFAPNQPFSVEVWINRDARTTSYAYVVDHENHDGERQGYYLYAGSDDVNAGRWTPGATCAVAGEPVTTGEWHYIVSTYSGSSGTTRLYVDTKLVDTQTNAIAISPTPNWSVGGQNCECTVNTFIGAIDELAIYPRELLEAEIKAHYAAAGH